MLLNSNEDKFQTIKVSFFFLGFNSLMQCMRNQLI